MNRQDKFMLGAMAGAAAVCAGAWALRRRHEISFEGRNVVITGGSRGLGLVLARQFADEGARVCILARDSDELARARQIVEEREAAAVLAIPCDVRSRVSAHDAIASVVAEWGGVDILVNNAGVIQVGPLEHMNTDDFENAMATHFWGPLNLMLEAIPSMRRRGFGRIVNVASIGGRMAVPHLAPYSASKFALVGLSDAFRSELDRHGIKVTTVSPGLMRTGSPINAQMKGQHPAEFTWFAIADALPGMSVSAESAARQILTACRFGDPELTIGAPARAAVVASALAPAAVAHALALVARLLPSPTGRQGDELRSGHESRSSWAPSVLTTLSDRAAVGNNEV